MRNVTWHSGLYLVAVRAAGSVRRPQMASTLLFDLMPPEKRLVESQSDTDALSSIASRLSIVAVS